MALRVIAWLSHWWAAGPSRTPFKPTPDLASRDEDAELAELAALLESGDANPEALECMTKLIGQDDSSKL